MKVNVVGFGVIALFYIIPFQDLIVSYLLHTGLPIFPLKVLLILKEIIVISLGGLFLFQRKISPVRLFLTLYILYVSIYACFSELSLYSTLVGFRTYLLLFFSFIIGENLIKNLNFDKIFLKHLKVIFFLLATFALLEFFVLPLSIWKNVFPVMQMKREVASLTTSNEWYNSGVPVNAFGELTRRMLGPFDEPLYMAYFTILITNFFLAQSFFNIDKPKFKTMLGSLLIILTQTRAIILGCILSIGALILKENKIKLKYVLTGIGFSFALIIISLIYSEWVLTLLSSLTDVGGRNIGHINAYVKGIELLIKHPFGLGVGNASSTVSYSESNNATENAFVNIGLEIGWLGLFSVFLFFVYLIFKFRNYLNVSEKISRASHYQIVVSGYLLALQFTFAGFVAPHILTARILIPFMIIIGWAYSITNKKL